MKKIINSVLVMLGCLVVVPSFGQDSLKTVYPLYLDFVLLDTPFLKDAARMNVNKDPASYQSSVTPGLKHYVRAYESSSMQQALALTKNFHAGNYYLNNRLWHRIITPDTKQRKIWNRVAANASAGLFDVLFTYIAVVFSPQWMHEEFHRNGLTVRGIASYDETYNRFNGGFANGSVSKVRDEDLVRLKKIAPQELVRSFSAGIESEFLLMRSLQQDNFYRKTKYPNVLLNILLTKHTVDYVNQFKRKDFNASIDSMNHHGAKISDRDFVGWDFTAWTYDLHRSGEPYDARGLHPSGTGIDRAVKSTDLTKEEYDYLAKMGRMQYLNFISPFMMGINRIRLNKQTSFNFAVRHYLNSFGYDLSTDVMVEHKGRGYFFSFHGYQNKNRFYPGIEYMHPEFRFLVSRRQLRLQTQAMLWLQPDRQDFYTKKAQAGLQFSVKASYPVLEKMDLYAKFDTKSAGWVAGNPYLVPNTGVSAGLYFRFQ